MGQKSILRCGICTASRTQRGLLGVTVPSLWQGIYEMARSPLCWGCPISYRISFMIGQKLWRLARSLNLHKMSPLYSGVYQILQRAGRVLFDLALQQWCCWCIDRPVWCSVCNPNPWKKLNVYYCTVHTNKKCLVLFLDWDRKKTTLSLN